MNSKPAQHPFPRNPEYGDGASRRRITLRSHGGRVSASLSDIFHEMKCWIAHDGKLVTDIQAETIRIPNTSCPGAVLVLQELIGSPVDARASHFYGAGKARRHCTHLLDLAVLAIAHAGRDENERIYDAVIPDEVDEPVDIEVCRNGMPVHVWKVQGGTIFEPEDLAGRPLGAGFAAWAVERFAGDELEAAMVLAKTHFIASGRAYLTEAWAGQPIDRNPALRGVCYSYAPERIAEGVFLEGNVRDFSNGVTDDDRADPLRSNLRTN